MNAWLLQELPRYKSVVIFIFESKELPWLPLVLFEDFVFMCLLETSFACLLAGFVCGLHNVVFG